MKGSVPEFGSDSSDCKAFAAKWERIRPELERSDRVRKRRTKWVRSIFAPLIILSVGTSLYFGFVDSASAPKDIERFLRCLAESCEAKASSLRDLIVFTVILFSGCAFPVLWHWIERGRSNEAVRLAKKCTFEHLGFAHDIKLGGFPLRHFFSLGLLSESLDREIDDVIEGRISGIPVQVCILRVGDRNTDSNWLRLCLIASDYPRPFRGRTVVRPNSISPYKLFLGAFGKDESRVMLNSEEFDRTFTVHSWDEAAAKALLPPSAISGMLRLWRPIACEFSVVFDEGRVYVALADQNFRIPDPGEGTSIADPIYLKRLKSSVEHLENIVRNLPLASTRNA